VKTDLLVVDEKLCFVKFFYEGVCVVARKLVKFSLVFLVAALADTHSWIGSSGGDWNVAGKWDINAVPVLGDTAIHRLSFSYVFCFATQNICKYGPFLFTNLYFKELC